MAGGRRDDSAQTAPPTQVASLAGPRAAVAGSRPRLAAPPATSATSPSSAAAAPPADAAPLARRRRRRNLISTTTGSDYEMTVVRVSAANAAGASSRVHSVLAAPESPRMTGEAAARSRRRGRAAPYREDDVPPS